jgi:hypothetical protein
MKSIFGPLGVVLALCLLVNCNRARLEPNLPAANQMQTQGRGQGSETQLPKGPATLEGPRGREPQAGPTGGVCKAANVQENKIVKVLFVIDGSGSNFGANGSTPSDPNKEWRTQTLRQFITSHMNNKNFYYGMTLFKGTTSVAKIKVNGEAGFSNERAGVAEGFRSFLNTPDGGNTPYRAALKMAKSIIAADLAEHGDDHASYAVVMVSDGHATDYKHANDVIPDASAIKDLAPDRITLNSVYYSPKKVEALAPQYLKTIANIGEGAFIVANTKQPLKLEDIVRFSAVSCQ